VAPAGEPGARAFRDEERSPYVQLRREMDRLFEDFFRAPLVGGIALSSNVQSWPYLEVKETDDQVIVTAELPA
jgi:HSP20 family protein